jgi:hypothetical protein
MEIRDFGVYSRGLLSWQQIDKSNGVRQISGSMAEWVSGSECFDSDAAGLPAIVVTVD